jgi:acyl-CoA synthetase (AMP-forming)/AMP-acid ligase II
MDFGQLARKAGWVYRDLDAVVCEGERLTYSEMCGRACRLADGLGSLGLRPGDRVATLGDNMLVTPEAVVGLALGGFVRCPLYAGNPAEVHLGMIEQSGARALLVQDKHLASCADRLREAAELETVIVYGEAPPGTRAYTDLLRHSRAADPGYEWAPDDLYQIRFSAGTTGRSKAIAHTASGWHSYANDLISCLPVMEPGDSQLIVGSMSHGSGHQLWATIARGVKHVLMPAFDAGPALELLAAERCSAISILVPTMVQLMVNHPDARTYDFSALRAVPYGGAPITERTLADARDVWGDVMYQMYGQSEGAPATILYPSDHLPLDDGTANPLLRSVGRSMPNAFVKIVNDEGAEVEYGEIGEISILTAGNMRCLWGDREGTAARLDGRGWLRTRDLGWQDDRGYLYLSDRVEDMIITGGLNVYPAEIENALAAHPAVFEVAVIAVPHPRWGETPKAVVVPREGHQVSEDELICWGRTKLGSMKKPTGVIFQSDPLPKSPVGKVLRRQLRDSYRNSWPESAAELPGNE